MRGQAKLHRRRARRRVPKTRDGAAGRRREFGIDATRACEVVVGSRSVRTGAGLELGAGAARLATGCQRRALRPRSAPLPNRFARGGDGPWSAAPSGLSRLRRRDPPPPRRLCGCQGSDIDTASCRKLDYLNDVDTQNRIVWVTGRFHISEGYPGPAPLGLYSGALASRDIWWNGERIGSVGRVGSSRETEIPGDLDDDISGIQGAAVADLGQTQESELSPAIRERITGVEVGRASPVLASGDQVSTIVVCAREAGGGGVPDRQQIEDRLREQELAMLSERYLRNLRREATIITRSQ